ncbi:MULTISPECIES: hypothetical protein [unclassified Duganella]|uniref:hypothetical protein n=1 Tax=unclassified Duganella TaxID=2636909 RepID=UPI0008821290|nr:MULTISPECIES: hypothetical protein [unclassified Duganella]SDG90674.1 hypothetical protein SAMN05216320_10862 [Duganella sp. OV458]SDJ51630.1 hypothetical protein SAMN05428973_104385 [Duganella sp. OV510]
MQKIRHRWTAFAMLMAMAGIAAASADTTPKPGGVYRLKPGIYVAEGSECSAPANAAIRRYDGKGISTAHTHACKARVSKRRGNQYTVDQSCIDAGTGTAPRQIQHQQVTVENALTFKQNIAGNVTSYRYCPIRELPADLRKAAR